MRSVPKTGSKIKSAVSSLSVCACVCFCVHIYVQVCMYAHVSVCLCVCMCMYVCPNNSQSFHHARESPTKFSKDWLLGLPGVSWRSVGPECSFPCAYGRMLPLVCGPLLQHRQVGFFLEEKTFVTAPNRLSGCSEDEERSHTRLYGSWR